MNITDFPSNWPIWAAIIYLLMTANQALAIMIPTWGSR